MLIIAHRGCSYKNYNQNTIRAFKQVIKDGIKAIEFDVQRTIDDKLVIVHDLELSKVSTGEGEVKNTHSSYIKEIFAKTTSLQIKDKIPFLEEVFNLKEESKSDFILHLELKAENTAILTCELIKEYLDKGRLKIEDFVISSFYYNELLNVKKILPQLKLAYLCGAINRKNFIEETNISNNEILEKLFNYHKEKFMLLKYTNIEKYKEMVKNNKNAISYIDKNLKGDYYNDEILQKAQKIGAFSINTWHKNLTLDFVEKCHKKGFKVFTYTVNEVKDIQKVIYLGVDGFFTDFYKESCKQIEYFK